MDTPDLSNHPAAWRGDELLSRPDWMHRWSDAPPLAEIREKLETGSGAAMLRGYPVEGLPEEKARSAFLEIAKQVGAPVSQSASGELVFSVRDAGLRDGDPKARGPNTRKKLSYHTDRCDVIAFMCLNQAKRGGENYVVSSVAIYNEIRRTRPDLLKILMEPYLYQRHNVDTANALPYCEQPIFSFHEGHFAANLLRVLIERAYAMPETPDMTGMQREALDYVGEIADRPDFHVRFLQQPGDILFLNNWVTMHRRSEFEDHEETEKKRHILRIWLSVPNSRPLHPAFAPNYGATEAGAVRGGMKAVAS